MFVCKKLLLADMGPIVIVAVDVFVSTTDWLGLVAPTAVEPNVKFAGTNANGAGGFGCTSTPLMETLANSPTASISWACPKKAMSTLLVNAFATSSLSSAAVGNVCKEGATSVQVNSYGS